MKKIGILFNKSEKSPRVKQKLLEFAKVSALPLTENGEGFDLLYLFEKEILKLATPDSAMPINPIYFDFISYLEALQNNFAIASNPMRRALRVKKDNKSGPLTVIDATCGTGKDACFILQHGAKVHAIERNPGIFYLLEDALRRGQNSEKWGEKLSSNFSLELGDAAHLLSKLSSEERPDIIYLDPMYTHKKRGKSGKEMQLFKSILEQEHEEEQELEQLWYWAQMQASRRVVVKRNLKAAVLFNGVSFTHRGRSTRYDVYLSSGQNLTNLVKFSETKKG